MNGRMGQAEIAVERNILGEKKKKKKKVIRQA